MRTLRSQLPPLTSLVVFEATARCMNMTAAAQEMNISRVAVSRHIRKLEEYFQKPLVVREHRGLRLTNHGQELKQVLSENLNLIADTASSIRGGC